MNFSKYLKYFQTIFQNSLVNAMNFFEESYVFVIVDATSNFPNINQYQQFFSKNISFLN